MRNVNTITITQDAVNVSVSVFVYLDKEYPAKDMYVAYCPSLNIVGYGHGEEAAKKDFEYMLKEYLTEQLQNKTLDKDLKAFGWEGEGYSFPPRRDMLN